jgi:hypothetical protein
MNRRVAVPALAFTLSALVAGPVFGQAKPAAPTSSAPAAPAKWIPPVKGLATIEVMPGKSLRKGNDLVTVLKVKNTSKGPIALLGVDEYWYNKKRETVSGDSQKVRKLIQPGEIVEVTMTSPWKADIDTNQYMFSHANGKIDAKRVTKFSP